ncbi:hypothetical protein [Staphylococcus haemolyticus]|uniref:hypothetical protein n=1 Tax=Staphylococcus haemolyticus TaxID=1283 RepID=UPI00187B0121|nr:hypothetical protein [Staphylococcus haemolyticus]MBE7342453.1 hypothetical protein [Staphylococcus haemolyticus]
MKKQLLKIGIIFFSLIVVFAFSFPTLKAEETNNTPNQRGKEMSKDVSDVDTKEAVEEFTYIMNNVFVYNENGELVDVDTQKCIDRYGYVPKEIQETKDSLDNNTVPDSQVSTQERAKKYKTSDQCFYGEMKNNFANLIPESTIAAMVEEAGSGGIKKATAVKLLKKVSASVGKGNIYGLAAQVVWTDAKCNAQYPSLVTG